MGVYDEGCRVTNSIGTYLSAAECQGSNPSTFYFAEARGRGLCTFYLGAEILLQRVREYGERAGKSCEGARGEYSLHE